MSTDLTPFTVPEGPGSVTAAPNLPAGFADTFTSRIVDTGGHRQHVVVGGDGPPLLLVHGWPESWYAWRLVMPTLAQHFTVVAVDQRGMGLTDKPETGYDSGTLAADLIALMDALGFDRFAVAGHDTGMVISYALAADNPERVASLVAAEIPGAPGVVPAPPLFVPAAAEQQALAHSRSTGPAAIAEQLISGREDIFFGYEFAIQGGPALPRGGHRLLRRQLHRPRVPARRPRVLPRLGRDDGPERRACEADAAMPVLAIGGAASWGDHVGDGMKATASDVQSAVVSGAGHWVAEQAPEELLAVLGTFLASYREAHLVGAQA